jgi:hypothetical protein
MEEKDAAEAVSEGELPASQRASRRDCEERSNATRTLSHQSNSNASFAITIGRVCPMFSSNPAAIKLVTSELPP